MHGSIELHFGLRYFIISLFIFSVLDLSPLFLIPYNNLTFNQLEDHFEKHFEEICAGGGISVDWEASPGILKPAEYLERWRMILWDKAFLSFLHPSLKPPFLKSTRFEDAALTDIAVKRVLYRYIPLILL